MREVRTMFECYINKGKLQLQCKVGFHEIANCLFDGQQMCSCILQNLSGMCFTTTIWDITKFGLLL